MERYRYNVYGRFEILGSMDSQKREKSSFANPYYFTARRFDSQTGLYIYEFVLFPMVCGGVSMEIDVDTGQFAKKDIARLDQLRSAVIKARPSIDTLYWPLKPNLEVSTLPTVLE